MIGKKKFRDFEGGQGSDSKDTKKHKKKKTLQTPSVKKKFLKRSKASGNFQLQFGLTTPRQVLGLEEDPKVREKKIK